MKRFKFLKLQKIIDIIIFILCLVSGGIIILNDYVISKFIFFGFWAVLIISYIRLLDYNNFIILLEEEQEKCETGEEK